jgi:hypothetical protein
MKSQRSISVLTSILGLTLLCAIASSAQDKKPASADTPKYRNAGAA